MSSDPLALDAETMRRMGYDVVDLLVRRIGELRDEPVIRTPTRSEMAARLGDAAPERAEDFGALLRRLDEEVLPMVGHFDHPRFLGYIPGAGTWPGALGDLIAAAANIDAGAWREAAGPSQLELTVLDWFREWIGYPSDAAGVLVSGGSAANLTAIACAREALVGHMSPRIVAYASDQTHSSVARAARQLGFRPDQIRVMPSDDAGRMQPSVLAAAIDADLAATRLPFLVLANAGTTNTGAIDPLPELSAICRERGLWLHVDGAYGAFAVMTERGRRALAGLELADSVTLDPHKWLAMPFEVGCLMVRSGAHLEHAFELHTEYLSERSGSGGVDFADRGLQLTRASRAIKVWLSLRTFGVDAFRRAIDRAMDQVALAQRRIEADDRLELVSPASLGILTFRRRGQDGESSHEVDRKNGAIVRRLAETGEALLTSTLIAGRYAIRLCILNHTTDDQDVIDVVDRVASIEIASAADDQATAVPVRSRALDVGWLGVHEFDADRLRSISVFGSVADDDADRFLGMAREVEYERDASVTERWAFDRTFYLVVSGRLSVRVDDREVNVLRPGDHFGEIAAIDWCRDFSYGRTASVTALEATRLLAFPAAALRDLMSANPEVDREMRGVAHARLTAAV